MEAALAGGVTSLACPPDTDPPLDEPGLVEMLKHRARSLNQAHVYPVGALTVAVAGHDADRNGRAHRSGLRRVLARGRAAGRHASSCCRAMQYASTFGYPLWLRPDDPHLGRGGVAHDGEVATRLGPGRHTGRRRDDRARDDPGARARHRRARAPVPAVVRGKRRDGARRKAGGASRHLRRRDPPPAPVRRRHRLVRLGRAPRAAAARRRATARRCAPGSRTARSTSSVPITRRSTTTRKQVPFGEAEPGATGLELLLPLTLKWAQEDGIALPAALARITSEPAKLIGGGAGDLAVGRAADLCVFDPDGVLEGRAREPAQPGQEHAVPRAGSAGQGALHAGRRAGCPRAVGDAGPLRRAISARHAPPLRGRVLWRRSP